MKKVLFIHGSITGPNSNSTKILKFVEDHLKQRSDVKIETLNLDKSEFAITSSIDKLGDVSKKTIDYVNQFDVLVIGSPLYNFSVSGRLKNFLDHLPLAGVSFKYTEKGPVGILNKDVYVFSARGGMYAVDSPMAGDTALIQNVLGNLLGWKIKKVMIAEGLSIKDDKGNLVNPVENWLKDNQNAILEVTKQI